MKLYTKEGDSGFSSVRTGTKLSKSASCFQCLGDLDELNSHIGFVIAIEHSARNTYLDEDIIAHLETLQHTLFDLGAIIACPSKSSGIKAILDMEIKIIEGLIDTHTAELPHLTGYILPGGNNTAAAYLHVARSVCRRCERTLVAYSEEQEDHKELIACMIPFVNRLSDYLFTLARYASQCVATIAN